MSPPGSESGLGMLHGRLASHFRGLAESRIATSQGAPVFALEHGLGEPELALLRREVLNAVQLGELPSDVWLPFVVYAAEIGYDFSGDEYWQTFSRLTPGWTALGDFARQYMRDRFREFRNQFLGAEPSGPWAEHFTIICWPITHAVLPTDLQRHLARLLFDFRRSLTAEDLSDPEEFGRRLAARSWNVSSRFQAFAQNRRLLGQVATALLTGEEEESTYLLPATLIRIVNDLSQERQSLRWLRDAKATARSVRTRGFQSSAGAGRGREDSQNHVVSTDPKLLLREEREGWNLYLELPDLAPLAERLPAVTDELNRLRPLISGVERRLAGGYLMFPGQLVKATSWPKPQTPLIQLENGSPAVNEFLADQCLMSPGPLWLFRIRTPSHAGEVRGRFVRPGHQYILVSTSPVEDAHPSWVSAVETGTDDTFGYRMHLPVRLGEDDLKVLATLGVGAIMDVDVRPAAYLPATWDGEGTAEWLEGEEPLISIRSSRGVARCIVKLDNEPTLIAWPEASNELIVGLGRLRAGSHVAQVALVPVDDDKVVIEGSLDVVVRPPQARLATGTPREGIMILASPARPTLEELWDGRAFLELIGPAGARATVSWQLQDRMGRSLIKKSTTAELRVDGTHWLNLLSRHIRGDQKAQQEYDRAEACEIAVTVPGLGSADIQCERSFTALRWAFGRDRDGPYLLLVDNTSGGALAATCYDFSNPTEARPISADVTEKFRLPQGGLAHATDGAITAAAILPPLVRTLEDYRKPPSVAAIHGRSLSDLAQTIELAGLWAAASLPSDPFAAAHRLDVLRAFVRAIASVVGGERWARVEKACAQREPDISLLAEAVGDKADHRRLANGSRIALQAFHDLKLDQRVARFAGLLRDHLAYTRPPLESSEFVLRLASEPWTLLDRSWSDFEDHLQLTLDSPVLLRAARLVVLATTSAFEEADSVYAGWRWQ